MHRMLITNVDADARTPNLKGILKPSGKENAQINFQGFCSSSGDAAAATPKLAAGPATPAAFMALKPLETSVTPQVEVFYTA